MTKEIYPHKEGFSPFRELVGVTFTIVENGFSRCILKVAKKHLNHLGNVHSGTMFTLADSGMRAALQSCIHENESCATVENHIFYFKQVRSGTLVCDTRLIHYDNGMAALESEVKNRGRLVAKVSGTLAVFKVRSKLNT